MSFRNCAGCAPTRAVRPFVASQPPEELFVSTVTFAEIRYGIEAIGDPIRRAELMPLFNPWVDASPRA
jgi:predicted nucleic acid-binding protein